MSEHLNEYGVDMQRAWLLVMEWATDREFCLGRPVPFREMLRRFFSYVLP